MKELYTSPEMKVVCFASEENIAAATPVNPGDASKGSDFSVDISLL